MTSGGKRNGAGSKPRCLTPSRNHSIKFTDEEWLIIKEHANQGPINMSTYIRNAVHMQMFGVYMQILKGND